MHQHSTLTSARKEYLQSTSTTSCRRGITSKHLFQQRTLRWLQGYKGRDKRLEEKLGTHGSSFREMERVCVNPLILLLFSSRFF